MGQDLCVGQIKRLLHDAVNTAIDSPEVICILWFWLKCNVVLMIEEMPFELQLAFNFSC